MQHFFDILFHLEKYIEQLAVLHPLLTYCLMFAIVFVETSFFPAAPVLPGDGLLFAVGVLASGGIISLWIALPIIITAGFLGNQTAYLLGHKIGPEVFLKKKWLSHTNYQKTVNFYDKQGNKAMLISRFIPVIRAIVPFVAGIASMQIKKFTVLNFLSVTLWAISITFLSYFLGGNTFVKNHFTWLIYGMVLISLLPVLFIKLKQIFARKKNG